MYRWASPLACLRTPQSPTLGRPPRRSHQSNGPPAGQQRRHAGPHQNRSKHSHISERCATGTKLWPLALAHPRQRAAVAGMGRTLAGQQQKHAKLAKAMRPHSLRRPLPFYLACIRCIVRRGEFGTARARERTRMLVTGGDDKIGQPVPTTTADLRLATLLCIDSQTM